jgi:hypothetical protein
VPDDTPKPAPPPQRGERREPGDYYYDDATGYEIYKPDGDEDGEEAEKGGKELTTQDTEGRGGKTI